MNLNELSRGINRNNTHRNGRFPDDEKCTGAVTAMSQTRSTGQVAYNAETVEKTNSHNFKSTTEPLDDAASSNDDERNRSQQQITDEFNEQENVIFIFKIS